ncbi:hypothetical protein BDF21DRAFT_401788 [Thamnidium elegans]|nr:hypothetical protein BDF21DRAFT_401788 [Thamnidium elegans]
MILSFLKRNLCLRALVTNAQMWSTRMVCTKKLPFCVNMEKKQEKQLFEEARFCPLYAKTIDGLTKYQRYYQRHRQSIAAKAIKRNIMAKKKATMKILLPNFFSKKNLELYNDNEEQEVINFLLRLFPGPPPSMSLGRSDLRSGLFDIMDTHPVKLIDCFSCLLALKDNF